MEIYKIENLNFTYPNKEAPALIDINLSIKQGEFVSICGRSGCGKTTLLRLLKPAISPHGKTSGNIYFSLLPLHDAGQRTAASQIGFVSQSVDNQIVTDKVWHELAFGLESLGLSTPQIRARVSEMASFFGIQSWFHKKVTELSGGQKQILSLASVMVMQPSVLLLDEPTSQLDPIAAEEFIKILEKINRETATTIIISEHRLEEVIPLSDRVIVMEKGEIVSDAPPCEIGKILKEKNHDMYEALPTPMRVYGALNDEDSYPLTVRDGRLWLEEYTASHTVFPERIPSYNPKDDYSDTAVELKDVYFRYEKDLPDVIKNLNMKVKKGECFAIMGSNAAGKTTALSLIAGLNTPQRGKIMIDGKNITKIDNLYDGVLSMLPQNPQALFEKKTLYLDLLDILSDKKMPINECDLIIKNMAALCRIEDLLESHPYDLSGGEQQRAALCKVLLKRPRILLLDEPTKGFDAHFKKTFADILYDLKKNGVTVIMVSHDIEFCAKYADRCAMFFDGNITSEGSPREFFVGKSFYTTAAARMAHNILPEALLAEDIITALGGKADEQHIKSDSIIFGERGYEPKSKKQPKKLSKKRIAAGCAFAAMFVATCIFQALRSNSLSINIQYIAQLIAAIEFGGIFVCFFPQKEMNISIQQPTNKRSLTKRTLVATILILLAIPLTIYIGVYYLGDRKYLFISLSIIIETLIPFFMVFENRKPKARELVIISVLCAIAALGRTAFFMLPQFKPIVALIIICGVCFGAESGFLVGAVASFVSNFFFGQGPWTPWQMFTLGIIGFVSGLLFRKGIIRKTKMSLCVFGFFATLVIYGGIINPASVIMWYPNPPFEMIISAYIMGIPYDLIHAAATAFFLWFIGEPMIDKLERIKIKYGLIEI